MIFGLVILLALQLALFVISGLVWLGVFTSQATLPPLDRATTLLSLVWIAWLWAFPQPSRTTDLFTLLTNILVLAFLGVSFIVWSRSSFGSTFNQSYLEILWQILSLAIIILGAVVIFLRRQSGWSMGLIMLGLAFTGHISQLIWRQPIGNFPGLVRLAQLAFYPLLLNLPQLFPVPEKTPAPIDVKTPVPRRYTIEQKTFEALIKLATEINPDNLGYAITRSVAHAMVADLCFLVLINEKKILEITHGFDLIREEYLHEPPINNSDIPLLASAIQHGRPLRLHAYSNSVDLKNLGQMLGLTNIGNLLSVPILSNEHNPIGAILLLSPYSNRQWSSEDQAFLHSISIMFAPITERVSRNSVEETEVDRLRQAIRFAQEETAESKKKYIELQEQIESTQPQSQFQAENMAALLSAQEEAQQTIAQLRLENEKLLKSAGADGISDQTLHLERELRLTLEEIAHLQNSLASANIRLQELENQPIAPISSEQAQALASLSLDLRQPMSSVIGYTDFLLGESVGILGDLQRKYLERIKIASQRLSSLMDELTRITALDISRQDILPELIDLNLIVDKAIAYTSSQLQEKNITLQLDLPETSLQLQLDREALQQIIIHLLQNASSASMVDGTVSLRVQVQREGEQDYLLVQVTDTGGGIQPEDIPHVFERRYRAENVLIQGLGDTGVGLSICKSLVEAYNGRLWVETTKGIGSIFSALLPVALPTRMTGEL